VVAGIRTPQPINQLQKGDRDVLSLEEEMPKIYEELDGIRKQLDTHYREMQDIEFTIQKKSFGCSRPAPVNVPVSPQ
jgi:pyruvate,orthophosphate dikinase